MDDIKKILTYINYPTTDELNFDGRSSARDYIEANKGLFSFDFKLFTLKEELDPKFGVLDSFIMFDDNNRVLGMNMLLPDLDKEFLKDDPSTKSGTKVILDDASQQAIVDKYGRFGSIFEDNSVLEIRSDGQGDGSYASRRTRRNADGSTRKDWHRGIDIISSPGKTIISPISGRITLIGRPYGAAAAQRRFNETGGQLDVRGFKTLHITGTGEWEGIKVVMMYVDSVVNEGDTVSKGQRVAKDQGIGTNGYNNWEAEVAAKGPMIDHVHFEVHYEGNQINPIPFFG